MLLLLKDYTQQIFCIYNNKLPITFILLKFIPFISQNFSKKYSFIRFILYRFLSVSLPIEFQELCQIPLRRQNWKSSVSVSQEPSLLLFYTAYIIPCCIWISMSIYLLQPDSLSASPATSS